MNEILFTTVKGECRPPKSVVEYFTVLYCNRRKICSRLSAEPRKAWNTLNPAERKVFIDKFEKWRAENEKIMTRILENAEPFFKKKDTKEKARAQSHGNTSVVDYNDREQGSVNLSASSYGGISNANSEVSKLDDLNVEFFMNDYDDDQSESMMNLVYDDSFKSNSGVPNNQHYTASVIDTDMDESIAQEEIQENETVTNAALPEPTLTIVQPKELFRIIKASGTRPELAAVEWKNLTVKEKRPYYLALKQMKREYLIKYEQYLESLPSPELFNHYIKFKSEN